MPFASEQQRRMFFARAKDPKDPEQPKFKKLLAKFRKETPKGTKLPKYAELSLTRVIREKRRIV
jgi:hypothetical protein